MLPKRVSWAAFRTGADRAARKRGPGVVRLHRNLSTVIGADASDELLRQAVRSYARYWLEAFRLPSLSTDQIRAGFRLDGWEDWTEACLAALPPGAGTSGPIVGELVAVRDLDAVRAAIR